MGGGQPLSDGLHHIDGDSVSGLLVKLGVGVDRCSFFKAVIREALQPEALLRGKPADAHQLIVPNDHTDCAGAGKRVGETLPNTSAAGL